MGCRCNSVSTLCIETAYYRKGYSQRKHSLPHYYFITGNYNLQHADLYCRSYDYRHQSFINIYHFSRIHHHFIAHFFHELISVNKGFGIILVAAGVVLLITKGTLSRLLNISFAIGDVWMLAAAITFAIYSILLKRKPEQLSIWAFQLSTFILGLIFLFPFFVWEYVTVPPIEFDAKTVVSILYVGVFASLSAFVLWNKAIATVGPSKAGMIYYTLPLFSGFLAHLFLKEDISMMHFYCVLLIISGILTANYESKKG